MVHCGVNFEKYTKLGPLALGFRPVRAASKFGFPDSPAPVSFSGAALVGRLRPRPPSNTSTYSVLHRAQKKKKNWSRVRGAGQLSHPTSPPLLPHRTTSPLIHHPPAHRNPHWLLYPAREKSFSPTHSIFFFWPFQKVWGASWHALINSSRQAAAACLFAGRLARLQTETIRPDGRP